MVDRERGAALLAVLWTLAILAVLLTRIGASAHGEMQVAGNVRTGAELEAQADGLVYATIAAMVQEPGLPMSRAAASSDAEATVSVADLAGRINPNIVSAPLLAAFFQEAGLAEASATALAAAIGEWRMPVQDDGATKAPPAGWPFAPPGMPFGRIEELLEVPGMTPALLARLSPHMTIDYPTDPDAAVATPLVAAALRHFAIPVGGTTVNGRYADIDVRIARRDGAAFHRHAVVWASASPVPGWRIVRWQ